MWKYKSGEYGIGEWVTFRWNTHTLHGIVEGIKKYHRPHNTYLTCYVVSGSTSVFEVLVNPCMDIVCIYEKYGTSSKQIYGNPVADRYWKRYTVN